MSFVSYLKEYILTHVPYSTLASGGKFIVSKCVFCGDGKHHDSRHFYISIGSEDEIPWCYCHLCHGTSRITAKFLSTYFNIYDMDLLIKTTNHMKMLYASPKNRVLKDRDVYILSNKYVEECKLSDSKLKYINDRMGSNLTYDDLSKLKIVLNLYDLLNSNNITTYTREQNIVNEFDRSFMGFISLDNAFVNLRNLRSGKVIKKLDKRYMNYNIFNKSDNTQRFYVMPNKIDLNNTERIKVHISEGPFDILSVYLNLRKDLNHNIYSSVCGSGFLGVIKHFINEIKLVNMELHLYKDNDMSNYIIYDIAKILEPFMIPMYLHTNTYNGEKDFGVPIERIQEKIERVT